MKRRTLAWEHLVIYEDIRLPVTQESRVRVPTFPPQFSLACNRNFGPGITPGITSGYPVTREQSPTRQRGIEATWNAYAALYARNAGYVSRAGMLLNGRAEIEQHHGMAFAGALRNTRLSLKARRISFLVPVVALVHADVELNHTGSETHRRERSQVLWSPE